MSAPMGRFGLCSSLRASNPSSSSSCSLSFLRPPSLLLLRLPSPSSSTSPTSNRAYSSSNSRSTPTITPSPSSTPSKRSFSSSSSSFAPPKDGSDSPSDMLRDTANQKRERDAQHSSFIRDWADLDKTKQGRQQKKAWLTPASAWYNPDTWTSHFRNSLSPGEAFKRIQMAYTIWQQTNSDLQRSLGRTEPAEQRLGLFPWTAEYKLQVKNRDEVLAQVQKVYDKFRVVEIRCDTQKNIDKVSLSSARNDLTKKFKDPRRNRVFLTATWERTMDHAKPKIISLVNSPVMEALKLSTRAMLVEFDFQEKITLGGTTKDRKVIDQRTKTTVLFEQRSWSEKEDEWMVRKRNVQKDSFGLTELARES